MGTADIQIRPFHITGFCMSSKGEAMEDATVLLMRNSSLFFAIELFGNCPANKILSEDDLQR